MISLIVPTMWSHPPFIDLLKNLVTVGSIGEIIIINNHKDRKPNEEILSNSKIRIHTPDSNLYVAPSWNFGAKLARYDNLAFLSDDLLINVNVFHKVDEFLQQDTNNDVGMVCIVSRYLDDTTYDRFYIDGSINIIHVHEGEPAGRPAATGMGNLFFIKRIDWKDIPNVKIFHGEVLQWNRLDRIKKNYVIVNCYNETPWHVTWKTLSNERPDEFALIQNYDQEYCEKIGFCFE